MSITSQTVRFACLGLAAQGALFASSAFAQSVTRVVTESVTATDTDSSTPQIGQTIAAPGASALAEIALNVPNLTGVELVECTVTASFDGEISGEIVALTDGTMIVGSYDEGTFGCGDFCAWGPSDFVGERRSFSTPQPLAAGESWSFTLGSNACGATSCDISATYNPSSFSWPLVQSGGFFQTNLGLTDLFISTSDSNFDPVDVELVSLNVNVAPTATVTKTLELSAAPLTEYCTSPQSSSGVPATLEAYGAQSSGSEWLTIRATGLPANTFSLLFGGTAPANTPANNTNICVGGNVTRESGAVFAASGSVDFDIDLIGRLPGQTFHLQAFFRDPVLGVAATNASSFVVTP